MDNDKYMELFAMESREHIQILNDSLLELENDNESLEPVSEIFRAAHTIKGMAGTLGFKTITKITHNMENILDEIRSQKRKITSELIDVLLECADTLDDLVEDVIELGSEGTSDVTALLSKLDGSISDSNDTNGGSNGNHIHIEAELDQYQRSIINVGIQQGLTPYWIEIKLQSTCLLKGARAYIIFQTLERFGEIIKSIPEVQDIEEEKFDDNFSILILSGNTYGELDGALDSISELDSVKIKEVKLDSSSDEKKSVSDRIPNKEDKKDRKPARKQKGPTSRPKKQLHSIRVDIDRLDSLMNLVSELIIVKNTMEDIGGYSLESGMEDSMEYLSRVTNELHDAVMKVRMVPIEMVFNRFPRVVRDLAKNTHKKINLNIVGAETEVDRTIIDEIGDPLIHLLRNAIDHGIEPPDERVRKGKNPEGLVDLIAFHDGNNVVIEIRDDGYGIDLDNIKNSAVDKGLVTEDKVDTLNDKGVIDLMFMPGFSTSETVSNISGRGVGMDVVKTKVESLGGVIEVETKLGQGSRFIIRLPLTLSIIQALLVEISGGIFAIPLSSILEIIDIPKSNIKRLREQEIISYRGTPIPLIRLEEELDIIDSERQSEEIITVVVIKKGEKQSALSIGNLIGQQEIVIKSLGKYLSNIKIISGATILGDGQVALILDINRLV